MALRSLLAPLCLSALLAAGCGSDDDQASSASTTKAKPKLVCAQVKAPAPKKANGQKQPTSELSPDATYDVTLKTSCGSFTIRLDQKQSPQTSASFAKLVRDGFYDDTTFHRIVPGFVIQGGDPLGNGTGGPGYATRDKPPAGAAYTRGVVAMAKEGTDPAGTGGSQFFVVTAADAGLPPDYAIFGKVLKGMDTVLRIEALGDPAAGSTGAPKRTVLIEEATLDEQ